MKMMETTIGRNFLKKGLAFTSLPMEHGEMECECDESKNNSCGEEEPPAWNEAVLKEREWELENCKVLGQNLTEAIKELKTELGI